MLHPGGVTLDVPRIFSGVAKFKRFFYMRCLTLFLDNTWGTSPSLRRDLAQRGGADALNRLAAITRRTGWSRSVPILSVVRGQGARWSSPRGIIFC